MPLRALVCARMKYSFHANADIHSQRADAYLCGLAAIDATARPLTGCPAPDKSARCQSIRPVRVSLSAIRPGASAVGATVVMPTAMAPGSGTPCLKDPGRTSPEGSRDRAGSTDASPPERCTEAAADGNRLHGRLPLHLARPGQSPHSGPTYPAPDTGRDELRQRRTCPAGVLRPRGGPSYGGYGSAHRHRDGHREREPVARAVRAEAREGSF